MNRAVNQTLSRTVMTSGLTFLTVIALFLFGGPVLHGFSFRAGVRDHCGYLFVGVRRQSDRVVLAQLRGQRRKKQNGAGAGHRSAGRRSSQEFAEGGQVDYEARREPAFAACA